jgi:hypothetical protein
MKISRSLFLALTGAIGGTACYVDTPPPAPPPPPPQPVVYQYAAPAPGPATRTYYYVDRWGRRIATRVVVRKRPAAPVGVATADPTYRPPPPNLGVTSPSTEGGGAVVAPAGTTAVVTPPAATATPSTASEGTGCLDTSAVAVPDCSTLKLDPSCGIRSFVLQKCNTYRDYFDPQVATVAVSCMEGLTSKQLCDGESTYACGKHALSEACPDTELAQLCSIAATSCKTTANDCTALLSGLNDTAKHAVAKCIATGCHAGLYSCVEGLASH